MVDNLGLRGKWPARWKIIISSLQHIQLIVLCFCPASFLPLKITSQFPVLFKKNIIPQVMLPPSYLSAIDLRLAGALQGYGEGVQLRSVQGSGVRGSAPKIDGYLEGKKGFSSSYQILLRGPSYFFLLASRKKNENSKLHFLWSEMIRPAAKLIL